MRACSNDLKLPGALNFKGRTLCDFSPRRVARHLIDHVRDQVGRDSGHGLLPVFVVR